MNTLYKVLVGAALVLGLAGLLVGLSNAGSLAALSSAGQSLGAIASKWTNFGNSGVTSKVGYAITSNDGSTTTIALGSILTSSGNYPVSYSTLGANSGATLPITTSTALTSNFDCNYDTISVTTSTAAITLTLPAATSTANTCLVADGTQEQTVISIAAGNSFNATLATSTGDTLYYNGTSTAGGAVLSTSTAATDWLLQAFRFTSSSVHYILTNEGSAH